MQIDCPHCGSQLVLAASSHDIQNAPGVRGRLHGDDHVCRECENELGVYYY